MDKFLTFTVLGFSQAAIIAIAASGLVVTYTTSGIFNFAHGAFGMMAAFTYWQLHMDWGVPTWPALLLVVFVIAPVFGAAVERFIMRGIEDAPEVVKIVVTVSLMVALLALGAVLWPQDQAHPVDPLIPGGELEIAGIVLPNQRLFIIGVAIAVAVGLRIVLRGTRLGIAMRAVVDNRSLLQLNGGRPGRTSMLSWAMGASLAAISGVLIAVEQPPTVVTLTLLVVNAYAAAVVGRLRSLPGAFLGAVILGLAMSYVSAYVPSGTNLGPYTLPLVDITLPPVELTGLTQALPGIMLFLVIVLQPEARLKAHGISRQAKPIKVPSQTLALAGGLVLVLVAVGIGSLMAVSDLSLVTKSMGFAIATLSLVPLTGFAGQISLAQLTFTGLGAVTMAAWGANGSLWAVLVSILVCALVGGIIALPALRLSGIYLALATAAFAIVCTWMVFNQQDVMQGGAVMVPPLHILGWSADTQLRQFVLLAVVFALIANALVALRRSSYGRRLAAMKDSPVACATLGLNLTSTKVGVFALSAAIAGAGGALANRQFVAEDFTLTASLPVTMLAVVGGIGSIGGALLGGLLLGSFPIGSTVFAANAIGVFRFISVPMGNVLAVMPGFMGIGMGRNPDGAASDIAHSYRSFSRSPAAMAASGVLLVALWIATKLEVIGNWSFFAAVVVVLLAVMPQAAFVLPPPGESVAGRRVAAGCWFVVAVALTAALPWATMVGSNGYRVLLILGWSVLVAGVGLGVHGQVDLESLGVKGTGLDEASPDMVGVDSLLTRVEAGEAARMLGIEEAELAHRNGAAPDDRELIVR
jgi:branched-chain amino acid transport system permease protein